MLDAYCRSAELRLRATKAFGDRLIGHANLLGEVNERRPPRNLEVAAFEREFEDFAHLIE